MTGRPTLIIFDAQSPVGAEVARYAVAMDYDVYGVTDIRPDQDEPWTHGVTWLTDAEIADVTARASAIIWPNATSRDVAMGCRNVIVTSVAPTGILSANDVYLVCDIEASLPVEQIAMAALRAAVEEGHSGIMSSTEVAHLGDAVMLQ